MDWTQTMRTSINIAHNTYDALFMVGQRLMTERNEFLYCIIHVNPICMNSVEPPAPTFEQSFLIPIYIFLNGFPVLKSSRRVIKQSLAEHNLTPL